MCQSIFASGVFGATRGINRLEARPPAAMMSRKTDTVVPPMPARMVPKI